MFVGFGIGILIVGVLIVIVAEIYLSPNAICPCLSTSPGQNVTLSCPNITSNFPVILDAKKEVSQSSLVIMVMDMIVASLSPSALVRTGW